ncbi:MAG: rod shape-determining protein RodA [Flavobacteriaceae bacterium]|jgi:rod shape determining protein RodA|nr:rod shape-determining protein RodA [Flavobacteriaceae bacterium]
MKTNGIDKLGLGLYFLLCGFAIANIFSVSTELGEKQLKFFGISVFAGILIFYTRSKFFENMAGIFYVLGIVLLVGLFPFGTEISGQKNWYKFGGFTMQPVEFAKIGTALMLANYISGTDFNVKNRRNLWTSLAIIGIPAVVVLAIPDIGSLLVFSAFFVALYREGLSGRFFWSIFILAFTFLFSYYIFDELGKSVWYVSGSVLAIGFLYILLNINDLKMKISKLMMVIFGIAFLFGLSFFSPKIFEKLPTHQKQRIEVLYKGESRKEFRNNIGYNLLYSKTAIGSGGLSGKGYKQGSVTQGKFVPEQETDYIFCTVGEEWGFLGSSLLIILYGVFIARIYYLSERQKSIFNRVFGYSFASILLIHFVVNLGMVMGLFPTVGIPLPYFSYGGSSLLAFSIMTFIFFKLNYTDRNSLV